MKELKDIIKAFSNRAKLQSEWVEIVGAKLAEESSPIEIKKDVLTVAVLSSSWSHHIYMLRGDIVRNARKKGYDIKRLKIYNSVKSKAKSAIPFYNEEKIKKIDDSDISKEMISFPDIKDEEIKKRVERLSSISSILIKNSH